MTRFALVGWSRTKEADEVSAVVIRLLETVGVACTGITFDNGKEFARHGEIFSALKADVFFARPYHSWERGTNENTNGLIRRLYPKCESFAAISEADLRRIDTFLNYRPRKCLGWKTPRGCDGRLPRRSRVSGGRQQRVKPSPLSPTPACFPLPTPCRYAKLRPFSI